MTSLKRDILDFADTNPGFTNPELLKHIKAKRKMTQPTEVFAALKDMTEGEKPKLTRKEEFESGRHGKYVVYHYWRA